MDPWAVYRKKKSQHRRTNRLSAAAAEVLDFIEDVLQEFLDEDQVWLTRSSIARKVYPELWQKRRKGGGGKKGYNPAIDKTKKALQELQRKRFLIGFLDTAEERVELGLERFGLLRGHEPCGRRHYHLDPALFPDLRPKRRAPVDKVDMAGPTPSYGFANRGATGGPPTQTPLLPLFSVGPPNARAVGQSSCYVERESNVPRQPILPVDSLAIYDVLCRVQGKAPRDAEALFWADGLARVARFWGADGILGPLSAFEKWVRRRDNSLYRRGIKSWWVPVLLVDCRQEAQRREDIEHEKRKKSWKYEADLQEKLDAEELTRTSGPGPPE